ncbi:MAG: PilZ domain-containing protein [Candidatus Acidiferrales bacterium]
MSEESSPSRTAAPSTSDTRGSGRRLVPRYPFIAEAELLDVSSGSRIKARTSEISLRGCYIDILNIFPDGSLVQLKIIKDNGVFETKGKVIYTHPGLGMGVFFFETPRGQLHLLEEWIAEAAN